MPLNGEEKMIGEKPPHCPQLGRYDCGTLQLLYYHDPFGDANSVVHWELRSPPNHGR